MSRALCVLAAIVFLCSVLGGCSATEEDASSTGAAIGDCGASTGHVYLAVKVRADRNPTQAFEDGTMRTNAGWLQPNTLLTRMDMKPFIAQIPQNDGFSTRLINTLVLATKVYVQNGPLAGRYVWINGEDARISELDANGNYCPASVRRASVSERMQSGDMPLPALTFDGTLKCLGNAAGGFVDSGWDTAQFVWNSPSALYDSIKALPQFYWWWDSSMQEIKARVIRDSAYGILYLLGSDEAYAILQREAESDERKVQAVYTLVMHALATTHTYLWNAYAFYRDMPPAQMAAYGCRLLGNASFEIVLGLATAGIGTAAVRGARWGLEMTGPLERSLSLLETKHLEVLHEASMPVPGRVGTSPVVELRQLWLIEHGENAWGDLVRTRDVEGRQRLLRQLTDATDPANDLNLSEGHCANSALVMAFMLSNGHMACPLPYMDARARAGADVLPNVPWPEKAGSIMATQDALTSAGVFQYASSGPADAVLRDLERFAPNEGQIAILRSSGNDAAHQVVVVRMNDGFYVVNNQGWAGAAPENALQSVSEWMNHWQSRFPNRVTHSVFYTSLRVPFQ